jgi:hypothetical protein
METLEQLEARVAAAGREPSYELRKACLDFIAREFGLAGSGLSFEELDEIAQLPCDEILAHVTYLADFQG